MKRIKHKKQHAYQLKFTGRIDMKFIIMVIMMVVLGACNDSGGKDYGNPVSGFDLEVGQSVHNDDWRVYKNRNFGPDCLLLSARGDSDIKEGISFYIFDNDAQAREAFGELPEHLYSISESDDQHIVGFENDVCDAEIKIMMYIEGNVIICAELGCYGTWSDGTDDNVPASTENTELADYIYNKHEYLAEYANEQITALIDEM